MMSCFGRTEIDPAMAFFLTFLVPDGESLIWRNVARVYIPLQQSQ
jgi:hypothetical protein